MQQPREAQRRLFSLTARHAPFALIYSKPICRSVACGGLRQSLKQTTRGYSTSTKTGTACAIYHFGGVSLLWRTSRSLARSVLKANHVYLVYNDNILAVTMVLSSSINLSKGLERHNNWQ